MGLFYRTIRMVDNGIKPVYVFDGKPPDMKGGELTKRAEKREEASKQLALATDAGIYEISFYQVVAMFTFFSSVMITGDTAEMDKLNRRLVKVNKGHTDECKQLLSLMGIPYVEVGQFFYLYNLLHIPSNPTRSTHHILLLIILIRHLVKLKPSVQPWLKLERFMQLLLKTWIL